MNDQIMYLKNFIKFIIQEMKIIINYFLFKDAYILGLI